MNKHVVILGYNAANYFTEWFKLENYSTDTKFYFVDNGQQTLPKLIQDGMNPYTTTKNIGCAGGWNLICDIAFNTLGLDKVIIGEEDALFDQNILDTLWADANENNLATTYGNGFGYALFCMHKDVFAKVGRFDENFLWAACEDNDYTYRCELNSITVSNLNVPSHLNGNATAVDPNSPRNQVFQHNADYINNKWSIQGFRYKTPFNGEPHPMFDPLLIHHFGDIEEFPSVSEYKKYCTK